MRECHSLIALSLPIASTVLSAGGPSYLAPKPLPPVQQMEVLRELGDLSAIAYSKLIDLRNDPDAAKSFVIAILEERLASVGSLEERYITQNQIRHVKAWTPRVRKDRILEFRQAVNDRK